MKLPVITIDFDETRWRRLAADRDYLSASLQWAVTVAKQHRAMVVFGGQPLFPSIEHWANPNNIEPGRVYHLGLYCEDRTGLPHRRVVVEKVHDLYRDPQVSAIIERYRPLAQRPLDCVGADPAASFPQGSKKTFQRRTPQSRRSSLCGGGGAS